MGFKLPPLSSVRVFEAAARHGSFKKAAEELNITASAVSHAVQNLEDWLGVALFQRGGGKLGLTEPGAAYAVAVGEALKAVAEATSRLPGRRSQGRLAISSAPGFAALWLLPRLSRFTERYPETAVDIETSLKAVDLPMEGIDAAIRFAPASRAMPSWTRLLEESLAPVCSPSLLEKHAGLSGLELIARADLIHMTSVSGDWAEWFRIVGARPPAMSAPVCGWTRSTWRWRRPAAGTASRSDARRWLMPRSNPASLSACSTKAFRAAGAIGL
jgi:LysR family transcriptional regulator, glycine cleavage system transcriptional activator